MARFIIQQRSSYLVPIGAFVLGCFTAALMLDAGNLRLSTKSVSCQHVQLTAEIKEDCSNIVKDDPRPSQELYEKIKENPKLLKKDPKLVQEFKMAPWLLPLRTPAPALPYVGLHNDIDGILKVRGMAVGKRVGIKVEKAITLMFFSRGYHLLFQNMYYTAVKYAEMDNHIVCTFSDEDLGVCMDLNLPCFNATPYLPLPLVRDEATGNVPFSPTEGYDGTNRHILNYARINAAYEVFKKGYAVHVSDSDIAYAPHPLWDSHLRWMEVANVNAKLDGSEARVAGAGGLEGPMNAGNWMLLQTPANLNLLREWAEGAVANLTNQPYVDDQTAFARMEHKAWKGCDTWQRCKDMSVETQQQKDTMAMIRLYLTPWDVYGRHVYAGGMARFTPTVDICGSATMYAHPLMITGGRHKREVLVNVQMWLIDDIDGCPVDETPNAAARCQPLRWRDPRAEETYNSCDREKLAFQPLPNQHYRSLFTNPITGNALFTNETWPL